MQRLPRHILIILTFWINSVYGQVHTTTKITVDSTSTINSSDSINEIGPKFLDGDWTRMNKYFIDNLKYPDSAKENGLSGKCYVKFTIATDGSVSDVVILKGVPGCYECDREVLRVVNSMPKWTPAYKNGTPVRTFITTNLQFKIQ